jgi:L-ascorbate metabolism protein UlaG (beta-lactamase superfamily)
MHEISVSILNHASILLARDGFALLTDPWFEGTAFDNGWGLRWRNDAAFEAAATASHLWVSHFHDDHLHLPTLRRLAAVNPGVIFIANRSYNFDMAEAVQKAGFRNIMPIDERKALDLGNGVLLTRYPATGIDNMLLIKFCETSVLNYNDCVLSPLARQLLARKIGKVDLFLSNFNHAGKLLHVKKIDGERVRSMLKDNFARTFQEFNPRVVVPFASHHYYRAPESAGQNESLLKVGDLAPLDPRIAPLEVGQMITFNPQTGETDITTAHAIQPNPVDIAIRGPSCGADELSAARDAYVAKIKHGFGPFARLARPMTISLTDIGQSMVLGYSRRLPDPGPPDIACHSRALYRMFTRRYGMDGFTVGAHFSILSQRKRTVTMHIALGMLAENKIDAAHILKMMVTPAGWRFLLNRREEVAGILWTGQTHSDYHSE